MKLFLGLDVAINAFKQAGRYVGGWRWTRAGKDGWRKPVNTSAPLSQTATAYWSERRAELMQRRAQRWQRAHVRKIGGKFFRDRRIPRHIKDAMRAGGKR